MLKLRRQFDHGINPQRPAGQSTSTDLDRLREISRELLAAGDRAIARALSGNSEAFLAANRQGGGQ